MSETNHSIVQKMCRVSLLHRYRISSALRNHGIYRGQPEILEYLISHGDCSQVEIANEMGVSPASVATSVKRLCKAGHIERSVDETDRRINRLRITEKGIRVLEAGKAECEKVDIGMFGGFSEEEKETFAAMLARIADNLSEENMSDRDIFRLMIDQQNQDKEESEC